MSYHSYFSAPQVCFLGPKLASGALGSPILLSDSPNHPQSCHFLMILTVLTRPSVSVTVSKSRRVRPREQSSDCDRGRIPSATPRMGRYHKPPREPVYSFGITPNFALKHLAKYDDDVKPAISATSVTRSPSSSRRAE